MPRGLRGKLFRCNALPHRTQPAARISSAIFSSLRTRNSTNLESRRLVWHIAGVSLVLEKQERQSPSGIARFPEGDPLRSLNQFARDPANLPQGKCSGTEAFLDRRVTDGVVATPL